jgi:hypothetical protein
VGALHPEQITARGRAAYVHVPHAGPVEKLVEDLIGVASIEELVDPSLAETPAILAEGFESEWLATIFAGKPAVSAEGMAAVGVNINRPGQRRHAQSVESVIGEQDQLLVLNQFEAVAARGAPFAGRLAVGGKAVTCRFHRGAHCLRNLAGQGNNFESHGDLALIQAGGVDSGGTCRGRSIQKVAANSLAVCEVGHGRTEGGPRA